VWFELSAIPLDRSATGEKPADEFSSAGFFIGCKGQISNRIRGKVGFLVLGNAMVE
jgi:hypothetical protein